jgi:hypothetical protein
LAGTEGPPAEKTGLKLSVPQKKDPIKLLAPMITPWRSAALRAADQRRQFLVPVAIFWWCAGQPQTHTGERHTLTLTGDDLGATRRGKVTDS